MVGALGILGAGAGISIVIRAVDQFTGVFKNVNAKLLATGIALTAVGIAGAKLVGGLIKVAGEFEQTNIAFTTMLGSAEKADKLLQELADFAARTPFEIVGVEQNAKMLLAMSIETEKLLPTLKALGDVSAGLSVPLNRIALNFGQVRVQGKLTGRELRDFAIAGVPLIAELAKNLNKSEAEIKEMVTAGDIGFKEVEDAFISMTSEGGKFFDLMDAQSKTFLGQVSNIKDSMTKVKRVMGKEFLPIAKKVAGALATIVEWMEQHPKVAKFTAILLGLVAGLALLAGVIILVTIASAALALIWSPVTLIVLGIAAAITGLIIGVKFLLKKWDELGTSTKILLAIMAPMITIPVLIIKHWDTLKVALAEIWNALINITEQGINALLSQINFFLKAYNKIARFFGEGEIGLLGVNFSAALIDIEALKKGKEVIEEITEEVVKQAKITETIDANQKSFASSQFRSLKDYENFIRAQRLIALGQTEQLQFIPEIRDVKGNIVNIYIEEAVGLDTDDLTDALQDKLGDIISSG